MAISGANIMDNGAITFFRNAFDADYIAAMNTNADPETDYRVEDWTRGFVVTVREVDGRYLGTL